MKNTLIILALVVIGFTLFYFFYSSAVPTPVVTEEQVSTTTPGVATTTAPGNIFTTGTEPTNKKIEVKIGQTVKAFGVEIKPLEIVEESRCPKDVQCIQAGTVRVKVLLSSGLGTSPEIFTLDRSVSTEAELVKLVEVRPYPISTSRILAGDYVFVFEVKKR